MPPDPIKGTHKVFNGIVSKIKFTLDPNGNSELYEIHLHRQRKKVVTELIQAFLYSFFFPHVHNLVEVRAYQPSNGVSNAIPLARLL